MSADKTPAGNVPAGSRVDVAGLRAAAEAATPGPWEAGHGWVYTQPIYSDDDRLANIFGVGYMDTDRALAEVARGNANAAHVAAADPTTVLALLDERDDLAARLATAEVENGRLRRYRSLPEGMVWQDYASPDEVLAMREGLEAENERVQDHHTRMMRYENEERAALKRRAEVAERQVQAARVEVANWETALDGNYCPSCLAPLAGPHSGCDHEEGYHHALSDMLRALALAPLDPDVPTGHDGHGDQPQGGA